MFGSQNKRQLRFGAKGNPPAPDFGSDCDGRTAKRISATTRNTADAISAIDNTLRPGLCDAFLNPETAPRSRPFPIATAVAPIRNKSPRSAATFPRRKILPHPETWCASAAATIAIPLIPRSRRNDVSSRVRRFGSASAAARSREQIASRLLAAKLRSVEQDAEPRDQQSADRAVAERIGGHMQRQ